MKTRNHLWITALVALILALVVIPGLTTAEEDFPQTPHLFYGTVTIGSNPAPAGTLISALVEGGGGSVTTTEIGKYGGRVAGNKLEVQPAPGSSIPDGAPITFYVNNVQAQGYIDGIQVDTVPFEEMGSTELNLQVSGSGPVTQYTISATAGDHGSISPSGAVTVNQGVIQSFVITPGSGFQVADVLVDGVSAGAVTSYTFPAVNAGHTISATFTQSAGEQFTLTASAGDNGSISPSGTVTVASGQNQGFTITPAFGFQVADVLVDGTSAGTVTSYTFTAVTANHTISATFNQTTGEQFTIAASAGDNGSISPSGTVTVPSGQNQSFTITADAGFQVADVLVDGTSAGAVTSYTFTAVIANHTISATFNQTTGEQFTIAASVGDNGSISPSGTVTVASGQNQSFTITPDAGFQVADVLVDGTSAGAVTSYTFTVVIANHTISATFNAITPMNFTIDAKAGLNGKIDPAGLVQVVGGTDKTFTITPDEGYNITTVIVDGIARGAVTNYTFTNVGDNHTISAYFAQGSQASIPVTLGEGWNIFSTPIRLEQHQSTIGEVFGSETLDNIELIYGWDGSEWFLPSVSYELQPLSAIYVKVRSPVTITLTPSSKVTAPPSRNLGHGFSLVGIAPGYDSEAGVFPAMPLDQALTTINELPGNTTGYVIVISPSLNQPGWTYNRGTNVTEMFPFKGYWIFMENDGEYGGFSSTPII